MTASRTLVCALLAWAAFETSALSEPGSTAKPTSGPAASPVSIGIPHTCSDYPEDAIVAGAGGTTVLAFQIASTGQVKNITVARSSGNTSLDQAAVDCASRWLYKPATQNGEPVEVSWRAAVEWILPDAAKIYKVLMPAPRDGQVCATRPAGTGDVHGETIVFFHILTDGRVNDATVERSSGVSTLDDYAKSCVSQWTYYPARNAAGPIEVEWYARLRW